MNYHRFHVLSQWSRIPSFMIRCWVHPLPRPLLLDLSRRHITMTCDRVWWRNEKPFRLSRYVFFNLVSIISPMAITECLIQLRFWRCEGMAGGVLMTFILTAAVPVRFIHGIELS